MANTKVKIPYPGKDGEPMHPIVYTWPAGTQGSSDNPYAAQFWERRRLAALKVANQSLIHFNENIQPLADLGNKLITMGNYERQKEIALLKHALPDFKFDNITDTQLVNKLNEIIRGKEQFKYALDRIQLAIQFGTKKAKTTGQDFKGMAPSIASTFLSYLGTEMSNLFRSFYEQVDPSEPAEKWGLYLETHFDKAVDRAMERMLIESQVRRETDNIYGDSKQWEAIGEAYKASEEFQRQFKDMLRSKLGVEELGKAFKNGKHEDILIRAGQKNKKSGFRTMLDKEFKWKAKQYAIGGSVAEYVEALVGRIAPKGATIGERATKVLVGETMRTDSVDIFRFDIDGTFSAEKIAEMLNEELLDNKSLSDAAKKMSKFYKENLQNLDETFIIYTSTKNYSLGAGFSGFHNGDKLRLDTLPNYVESIGIDYSTAMDFVYTAYNALRTAIYYTAADEIKEDIEYMLMSAAARLMFDDWETIGIINTGAQQLHVFDLDGLIIPSSYLLRKLGDSMKDAADNMRSWVSVRIQMPHTVVYHPRDWREFVEDENTSSQEIKDQIYQKWEEQYEITKSETTFSVKFLYNFKKVIKDLVEGRL